MNTKHGTNLKMLHNWWNEWWIWRTVFSWIFPSLSSVQTCKSYCRQETSSRAGRLESIGLSYFCDESRAIRRTIAMRAIAEHLDGPRTGRFQHRISVYLLWLFINQLKASDSNLFLFVRNGQLQSFQRLMISRLPHIESRQRIIIQHHLQLMRRSRMIQ